MFSKTLQSLFPDFSIHTLTVQLNSQTINMVIAHNWVQLRGELCKSVKTLLLTKSSPSWSVFHLLHVFQDSNTWARSFSSHSARNNVWQLHLHRKTIQKYITLLLMQYIYYPKRQTVAPISNSVIFYIFNVSFCQHQANKWSLVRNKWLSYIYCISQDVGAEGG